MRKLRCLLGGMVLVAMLALAACGGGQPTLAESPLPAPSVTGTIVFEKAVKPGAGGNGDIYVVNADGTGLKALAEAPSWAEHPSWSPDGTRIVWATYPAGSEDGMDAALWVMNADGSGKRPLAEDLLGDWAVWSPDGTQIAFSRNEGMGEQDIYVIGADGSGLRQLTSGSGDVAPAWAGDGRIFFLRSSKVFAMNSDGSGLTQVTHGINASDFGLSPDGKTLALHDYTNDRIVAVSVDGSGSPVTLLEKPSRYLDPHGLLGKKWAPAWTPDGKAVVLTTNLLYSVFGTRLYVVNADGSGLTAVPGIENAIDAAWKP
jgi:Tol biopolymer transport system component